MQTSINLKFNNTYDVKLINSTNGEIKQSGSFHNIVTKNLMQMLMGGHSTNLQPFSDSGTSWVLYNILGGLAVGSGTNEPSFTDTALQSKLWDAGASSTSREWLNDYTVRCTGKYSFPATSSYVGTISEAGLCPNYREYYNGNYSTGFDPNCLMTHSLFTDSEGQVISFNKTDIDILEVSVTVEISMASSSENFILYKKPYLLAVIAGFVTFYRSYNNFSEMGGIDLRRYRYDLENLTTGLSVEQAAADSGYKDITLTYDGSTAQITVPQARMGTGTITEERYYKAVALPFLGYWKLPNENVLPAYTISGLQVGVGDGVTTTFENPLNYFKAGSDKVYKNGVQLVNGVDYTLSNICNKDYLTELSDFNYPIKVTSSLMGSELLNNIKDQPKSLIRPSIASYKNASQFDINTECCAFNYDNPILIEYEEAVTLNYLKAYSLITVNLNNGDTNGLYGNYTLYVDASQDGEVYDNLGSYTANSGTFTFDFTETTAKYWRIRTSYNESNRALIAYDQGSYLTLGARKPNIVFTEAPAADDVITMDVEMDVIMKNSNFVLDIGCSITFSM